MYTHKHILLLGILKSPQIGLAAVFRKPGFDQSLCITFGYQVSSASLNELVKRRLTEWI